VWNLFLVRVKLGKHVETGQQYAVKIIEKKDIAANSMAANVKREISIMRALKHPNIVNFHEVLISKSSLFIVMDLVKGDELYELLRKRGRLTERDAKMIFRQLVNGISYCHEQGIFHRDLKPENIMMDGIQNVKITDFGMSAMTGLVNEAGNPNHLLYTACGTLYYCAPEILSQSGSGYSGEKVDAWSCGILLYLMIVGRLPFESEDMNKLTAMVQNGNVRFPNGLSAQVVDLISRLLDKNPETRLSVANARHHPWVGDSTVPAAMPAVVTQQITRSSPSSQSANGTAFPKPTSSSSIQIPPVAAHIPLDASQNHLAARDSGMGSSQPMIQTSSNSLRQSASDVRAGVSSLSLAESEASEDHNTKMASLAVYHGRGEEAMIEFMKETLPGKSEAKVMETVQKLAEAEIECVEDLEAVARELNNKNDFKTWLSKEAGIPVVTSMRLSQRLF